MKKLLAVLVLVLVGTMSYAQWQYNAPHQYLMGGGNVGIGISNPAFSFQAQSSTVATGMVLNTDMTIPAGTGTYNLGQFDMRHNGFATSAYFYRNVFRYNRDNSHYEMLQTLKNPGGTLAFLWVDLNNGKFEMRSGITSATFLNTGDVLFNNGGTGRVGIGVATFKDGVKFQVNGGSYFEGRVRCHEVEVALAPTFVWPDYVFNSGYKLTPLSEVETFVLANKHLPGVPSQEEISSDGVKLGEMNATLLQKVEELTLYMINLQKENDALKARVSNLEK